MQDSEQCANIGGWCNKVYWLDEEESNYFDTEVSDFPFGCKNPYINWNEEEPNSKGLTNNVFKCSTTKKANDHLCPVTQCSLCEVTKFEERLIEVIRLS